MTNTLAEIRRCTATPGHPGGLFLRVACRLMIRSHHRKIIESLWGISGPPQSRQEVAKRYGVTISRVQTHEAHALRRVFEFGDSLQELTDKSRMYGIKNFSRYGMILNAKRD